MSTVFDSTDICFTVDGVDFKAGEFNELVKFLRKHGYTVRVRIHKPYIGNKPYRFGWVTGNNIKAGFCEPNDDSYSYIDGRIAADNSECYNKYSQCPLVMRFPIDKKKLLKHLRYLGTKAGYNFTNGNA